MVRRIAACAGLLALMVTLSACACGRAAAPAAAKGSGDTVCLAAPCVRSHDCTACYHSEADSNVGRTNDDLPSGGGCCGCEPHLRHNHVSHDPCAPCGR